MEFNDVQEIIESNNFFGVTSQHEFGEDIWLSYGVRLASWTEPDLVADIEQAIKQYRNGNENEEIRYESCVGVPLIITGSVIYWLFEKPWLIRMGGFNVHWE